MQLEGQCKDCKYFNKFTGVNTGLCQAHPPVFTLDRTHDVSNAVFWNHPVKHKDDGCGEFEQEV